MCTARASCTCGLQRARCEEETPRCWGVVAQRLGRQRHPIRYRGDRPEVGIRPRHSLHSMHSTLQYEAIKQIRDQLLISTDEYRRVAGKLDRKVQELVGRLCTERPQMVQELDRDLLQHYPGPGRARRPGMVNTSAVPRATDVDCPLRLCQWREQRLIDSYLAVLDTRDLLESTRALLVRQCSELERGLKRMVRLWGSGVQA